ncbi:hypothetical protein NG800_018145 [Epilithonimonas ginsengisoli]|uniref:DUF4365 domain-containing protein n=1 Tax=Epilithonimonas ginsengisoli TaxID=1245592 RepID=A0ABU4JMT3_9FLAO|nr:MULTISPECIES: hypothetical protein [Chryseobacterium group]MBV6878894.1 hypothetical protein [Epilithonimonas sp. FP105]MDW8550854.1 hypothetical protein [Epilithonimonas ginsengisoli]
MDADKITKSFRHAAAFGKRIEYYVIGLMLKQGLDVFLPMVDDDAIDAVIKKPDGTFVEIQIKARSTQVKFGDGGLFAALTHEYRKNYWFVFYSERMETTWILSSSEFLKEARQNKTGINEGKRSLKLNGVNSKIQKEHVLPQFQKYVVKDFSRIINESPDLI